MSLVAQVAGVLDGRSIPWAVIGAAALAVHGVPRATADVDILTTDPRCLDAGSWATLDARGIRVDIRRGDPGDPLAGVVRLAMDDEAPVDVVVGRHGWQQDALARAVRTPVGDATVPVVLAADLVLLKLYAGGPQDAWDVDQLLDASPGIETEVEAGLTALPADGATLWQRILSQRVGP